MFNAFYTPHIQPLESPLSWTLGQSMLHGVFLWSLCPSTPLALSPGGPASASPLQGPPVMVDILMRPSCC